MRKTFMTKPAAVAIAAIAVGGLLVGCGDSKSSSTKTKDTTATTSTTAKSAETPQTAALVTVKQDPKLGTVLADDQGLTLYTLTNNGKAVSCTGPCLTAWPPLVLPTGSKAPTGTAGVTGLTTVMGPNGVHLVAVDGLPLYRFVKDKDAEDTYGEGLASFGGVWHVSKTTAAPSAPTDKGSGSDDSTTTTEAPTTSSGY